MNPISLLKSYLLLFLVLSSCILKAQSNEGTLFWLAFPEHRDVGQNTMVVMITSKFTTSGMISIPNRNWSQTFSVNANDVTLITLPHYAEVTNSEKIDDLGIKITSKKLISAYMHQYNGFRSEASVILPRTSIDKEYYTVSYEGISTNSRDYPSQFLIVAPQDETTVTITLSALSLDGRAAGTTFSIILDEGETYQVQGSTGSEDMTGSHIIADKDIVVFAGNTWTEVPTNCSARDNLIEQMFPVSTWGKRFVSVPTAHSNFNVFRIVASEDNTIVTVDGNTSQTFGLNAGSFQEYQSTSATEITSNKPILVTQYLIGANCSGHSLGDPSMVLLSGVAQTRDTVTLYNSSLEAILENYINIIMPTADTSTVRVDGQLIGTLAPLTAIGQSGEYTYATVTVNAGAHTITSAGCGVVAMAYGYGNLESYAYSGGANFNSINGDPIVDGGCLNDTITFDAGLPAERYTFFWDISGGITSTEKTVSHIYTALGSYPIRLIVTDNCTGISDTLDKDILVSLRQAVMADPDTILCEGGTVFLGALDLMGATYEWNGPNGYFSEEQYPMIDEITPDRSGNYAVIGIISGCATFPEYLNVNVIPTPEPYLGEDGIFCDADTIILLDPGEYASYLWQDNTNFYNYDVTEEGSYWVQVTDGFGCIGSDSIHLERICPTNIFLPDAITPNYDGINDDFGVYGSEIISMQLDVFDRWGSHLFRSTNQSERWDGTFRGKIVDMGVYVWQLSIEGYLADGTMFSEVQSGTVTVIR